MSGRTESRIALVEAYSKAQGMWRTEGSEDPVFTDLIELDLAEVVPSMAGPKRPKAACRWKASPPASPRRWRPNTARRKRFRSATPSRAPSTISVMATCHRRHHILHQHLQPERADRRRPPGAQRQPLGLKQKPWVKTSLAPGSQVVAEYLEKSGLQKELDQIGFNLVGFGCTTCIGNSGPLPAPISKTINDKGIIAAAVLSGNRNFEAASLRTCRRTTSPPRRWSWPMRSPAP